MTSYEIRSSDWSSECALPISHNSSLLSHCADGRISLRRPVNLASPYVSSQTVDVEGRLRLVVAQLLVDEEQPDVSHLPSYFATGQSNLFGKVIGSREFIRLGGRSWRTRPIDFSTSEVLRDGTM